MKLLLLLYIFVLFILFSPSILFKSDYIIHSLCFSIILYLTYDLVKFSNTEPLKGDNEQNDTGINVNISNIHESSTSTNVLGELMLDAYQKVSELKYNITHLNVMLDSYKNGDTDEQLNQIIMLTIEAEGKLNLLKGKLKNLNEMNTNSDNLITENNVLDVKNQNLTNQLNKSISDMRNNEISITNNNSKITTLKKKNLSLNNNIKLLDKAIYSYKMKIPMIESEILNHCT